MNPSATQLRDGDRAAHLAAIAAYVRDRHSCSFGELFEAFGQAPRSKANDKALRRHLDILVGRKALRTVGSRQALRWVPGGDGTTAPATPYVGEIVQPRRVNVMSGSYTPPPAQVYRPGSMDFRRIGSVHAGRVVAYKAGAV